MARAYPPSTGVVEFVQEDGIWARRCRITPSAGARGHNSPRYLSGVEVMAARAGTWRYAAAPGPDA
ncbi:MAG: hypothetical protein OXH63_07445, partial [Gemmatimonadetes bacterium]|nr:hypothetical protein [Gemmatimonadota bacterium]